MDAILASAIIAGMFFSGFAMAWEIRSRQASDASSQHEATIEKMNEIIAIYIRDNEKLKDYCSEMMNRLMSRDYLHYAGGVRVERDDSVEQYDAGYYEAAPYDDMSGGVM